ncbi:MAG: abortive infection system antitoxin AbiGi family protein [Actinobacteria bacterium]|nr:abortive infection system antitoxin AbiGi family protein [Actinomycetota bacterium]
MSDYVVHFTRSSCSASAYDVMLSILGSGMLRASGPYGIAATLAPNPDSQKVVCFSEAPLDVLDRIIRNRGPYGIAFSKDFIISRGGGSVWYVEPDSEAAAAVLEVILPSESSASPQNPAWSITPFIEFVGAGPNGPFRWEREWRHVGHLCFNQVEPSFLFIPEELHDAARAFFEDARAENLGPCYECKFLDARWERKRVLAELRA